jgi:MFS family permease
MTAVVDAKKHRPAELRCYWPAVLACFATAVFAWGFGFSGTSVYLAELHRLHGWSRGLIGAAITTYYLLGAVCMTLVHVALRRAGPGRLLAAGTLLLGLGATLFSRSEQPWQMFGAAVLMAVGWAGCTTAAIPSALAMYFERQRGLAITLALNGASAAGFTVGPILLILSQTIGVENAVPLTALAALVIVLPLIGFGLREPPASGFSAAKPDSFAFAASGTLRSWRFFLLPHVGAEGAAGALATTSLAAISGRLALATVIDRLPQRVASAMSFASQAGGLALMLLFTNQPMALYAGCIIFGLSVGNVITFPALIVQREFPASVFGQVIGLSTAVTQFAYALAPALLGMIRDLTGGYVAVLLVCIGLQLAGAIVVLAGSRFPTSDLRTHQA